jgi:hypothetical protein
MPTPILQFNQSGINFDAIVIDVDTGDPRDLTSATSVDMEFRKPDNTKVIELAITVLDPLTGSVRYTESATSKTNIKGAWEYRPIAHFPASPDVPGDWIQYIAHD